MRDLRRYRAKRDPDATPEPFGLESGRPRGTPRPPNAPRAFVVQQHAARAMHWDLRLEIGGVLVSWAIPKGPSLDPADKRFAAQTEDHPLEYADFEGVIPPGNYGAGAMILWDRGTYQCVDGKTPATGLEKGKLDLLLRGHKLHGRFALVRTRGESGRDWLFFHKGERPTDEEGITDAKRASVLSGLTVEELAGGGSRKDLVSKQLRGTKAPKAAFDATSLRPMLASRGEDPFSRDGWVFELKYDGVRILASRSDSEVRLFTRNGADRTSTYPEIARAVGRLPLDTFVLDGEIVALDERGRSSFEKLQRRFTQTDPESIAAAQAEIPVVCFAFDLLSAAGRDLRGCPLTTRKEVLRLFTPRTGFVRFADHVESEGLALYETARANDLEGIIAKRASSKYETGRRSTSWLKIKVPRKARFVIVGATAGRGSRRSLGSLMLAWYRDGELIYAGNAGSGLDERSIETLLTRFEELRAPHPAFRGAPEPAPRSSTFLIPELVCEVGFTEVTSGGNLRHPVFLRLCEDADPAECVASSGSQNDGPALNMEVADAAPTPVPAPREPELALTRLDKIFWPVERYTKGDLIDYYEGIWPWLAPYLENRPVVLTRYPDGIEGKSFYQKNAPEFTPDWAQRENIDGTDFFVCNDLRTLLYVINSGAIPLHVWSARVGTLDRPDWLILDLDPKEASFIHVVAIARQVHRLLQELDAPHFVKTSGQDGLHILLPLGGALDHTETRTLAEVLARVVCAKLPEIATIVRPVAARGDKVYVDYLQNGRGRLIAAPFSVRPRPRAPVSTPLRWSQVTTRLDPSRHTIRTTPARMKRDGDPMKDVLGKPVDVESLLEALAKRLERDAN